MDKTVFLRVGAAVAVALGLDGCWGRLEWDATTGGLGILRGAVSGEVRGEVKGSVNGEVNGEFNVSFWWFIFVKIEDISLLPRVKAGLIEMFLLPVWSWVWSDCGGWKEEDWLANIWEDGGTFVMATFALTFCCPNGCVIGRVPGKVGCEWGTVNSLLVLFAPEFPFFFVGASVFEVH